MRPQSRIIPVFLVVSLLFPSQPVLGDDSRDATEVETLGIVVASHSATLGNGIASDGATLYNGDHLVTGPNGGLPSAAATPCSTCPARRRSPCIARRRAIP